MTMKELFFCVDRRAVEFEYARVSNRISIVNCYTGVEPCLVEFQKQLSYINYLSTAKIEIIELFIIFGLSISRYISKLLHESKPITFYSFILHLTYLK